MNNKGGKLPKDIGEALMGLAKGITKLKDGEEVPEEMEENYKKVTGFGKKILDEEKEEK